MNSIYHFFKEIYSLRSNFLTDKKLENFPFPPSMISCVNRGSFPDLAIKLNSDKSIFTGGELIELKDSDSYSVSSFNSTIPSGKKEITKFIKGPGSNIKKQMEAAGDNINSLKIREVFYLVRGKKNVNRKVVLVHGSFFETVDNSSLISNSFSQVFEELLKQSNIEMSDDIKKLITKLKSEQENFSKVREVEKASVKLRFRIMTEVKAEGNILNDEKYPAIAGNTINLLIPKHSDEDLKTIQKKFNLAFGKKLRNEFTSFDIKHHYNGYFRVYQASLSQDVSEIIGLTQNERKNIRK